MVIVVIAALAIWGLGHAFRVPMAVRVWMLVLLYLAVLVAFWILPNAGQSMGGTQVEWLLLGGAIGAGWLYFRFVKAMKSRATRSAVTETNNRTFSATELDRYARHIVMREIGGPGQKRLKQARVLVIGAGGLGAPVLQYLTAAGVGTIGVIDDDVVENSNLQRQVIHKDAAIGTPKVFSAEAEMLAQNPNITVKPYHRRLDAEIVAELFADYDLILDGTDNFDTRYLVNDTCVKLGKPLITAALSQWEGQISTYDPANGAPCYACVYPDPPAPGLSPSCAEGGVLGPLPGVLGAMMAVETVKEIAGAGEGLRGRMMIYDALYGENRVVKVHRRDGCDVCASQQSDIA